MENNVIELNGHAFGFTFRVPRVTEGGAMVIDSFHFCNFRRYGFSVQSGAMEQGLEGGTAQIAFAGYGGHKNHDAFHATFRAAILQFVSRHPYAAPVVFGSEFQKKAAEVLTGCFRYHEKHTGLINNEGYHEGYYGDKILTSEFRCQGDYAPRQV